MSPTLLARTGLVASALVLASAVARAQEFNLDVGGTANVLPSAAFGGAAAQPGIWDTVGTATAPEALSDITGAATGVTLTLSVPSLLITSVVNLPGASADQVALMTDILDPGSAIATWTITGLAPGEYDLYTYAMAPDNPTYLTDVSVAGSPDPTQTVGGAWPAGFVLGVTHARHHVTATGAPIVITFVETPPPAGPASNFASIGGLQIVRSDTSGSAYCAGDGVDPNVTTPCGANGTPACLNFGAAGNGCANSSNANGAVLSASGSPNPDTIVLAGSGMPATVACIYLQGDQDNVVGVPFGDGIRCVDGTLIRLRTKVNVAGASTFPDSTDTVTVSQRGMVMPGSGLMRFYQTYYRNAAAAFCPPETFNVTNGWKITW